MTNHSPAPVHPRQILSDRMRALDAQIQEIRCKNARLSRENRMDNIRFSSDQEHADREKQLRQTVSQIIKERNETTRRLIAERAARGEIET